MYSQSYLYHQTSVTDFAPLNWGVYYIGYVDNLGRLYPLYIGRASGIGVTIRSRLFDHLREIFWSDATHFCFRLCTTPSEAIFLETAEIQRFQPKYNVVGKS